MQSCPGRTGACIPCHDWSCGRHGTLHLQDDDQGTYYEPQFVKLTVTLVVHAGRRRLSGHCLRRFSIRELLIFTVQKAHYFLLTYLTIAEMNVLTGKRHFSSVCLLD